MPPHAALFARVDGFGPPRVEFCLALTDAPKKLTLSQGTNRKDAFAPPVATARPCPPGVPTTPTSM